MIDLSIARSNSDTSTEPRCLADFVDHPATLEDFEHQIRNALGDDPLFIRTPQIIGFNARRGAAPTLYQELGPICLKYAAVREASDLAVIPLSQAPRAIGRVCTIRSGLVLFRHASRTSRAQTVADESLLLGIGVGMPIELSKTPFEAPDFKPVTLTIVH